MSFKAPTCLTLRPTDGDLLTGHTESVFTNSNGGVREDSDVEIFESAGQAKARFVRFFQPKLAACLS
jgi:hypothetical protein